MERDPGRLCLDVPQGFDDTDAETQVHPMARKLFPAATAAEAFRKALDFLPLVNEGDSYGSRRGVFCFVADCPPGVLR
jgi:hypothetical protein